MEIHPEQLINELIKLKNEVKATFLQRFFKTGKGEYAEGDIFLGITVPEIRKIAIKYFKQLNLKELKPLISNSYHEIRLCALIILTLQYKQAEKEKNENNKKLIFNFYLENLKYINNWDLVDVSAHKIVGSYLIDKERDILFNLAYSDHLWSQRVAMMSTLTFIKNNNVSLTLQLAEIFLLHTHDLIHKVTGWMLREAHKKKPEIVEIFIKKHIKNIPRTMLRYAIEKFDDEKRKKFLNM